VVHQLAVEGLGGRTLALTGRRPVGVAGVESCPVDLADPKGLEEAVRRARPTHVLHLGAMTSVAECHRRPADAERINAEATRVLAGAAVGARFVFASTDMVFDGDRAPYREEDTPEPGSQYGRTKLAAERLLAGVAGALVVRLPLMFGFPRAGQQTTFVKQMAAVRAREPVRLFDDEYRTPAWLGDAARVMIGLARGDATGVMHAGGPERLSRYALIAGCAALFGIEDAVLEHASRLDIESAEPRPEDLSLDSGRLRAAYPKLAPRGLCAELLVEG
jgi:dTDP-4-dehydrorhamnose reductase